MLLNKAEIAGTVDLMIGHDNWGTWQYFGDSLKMQCNLMLLVYDKN